MSQPAPAQQSTVQPNCGNQPLEIPNLPGPLPDEPEPLEPVTPPPEPTEPTKPTTGCQCNGCCADVKAQIVKLEQRIEQLNNQIVNIQIPAGAKGDKGDRGERGEPGPAGPKPSIDEVIAAVKLLPITFQKLSDDGTKVLSQYQAHLGDYVGLVREKD